jgi:hypothetical protein
MDKGVEAHTLYNTPPVRQSKTASLYQCNNLSLSHYTAKAKMRQTKREAQLQGIEPRIFTYEPNSFPAEFPYPMRATGLQCRKGLSAML